MSVAKSFRGAMFGFMALMLLGSASYAQQSFKTPEDAASTYEFNKHVIKHRFCGVCGIHPYAEAIHPKTGKPTAAINIRCIEGLDLEKVPVVHFDGRAL